MAKFIINPEMERYTGELQTLWAESEIVIKKSVYDGAKIVMDAVKQAAYGIPVTDGKYKNWRGAQVGVSTIQKHGIIEGLGLASMRNYGGYIHTKIGADGYNNMKTKKYPGGQPNAMIIRALESGTSFRAKYPFISRATKATKTAAEEAMRKRCDEEIKKIMR